MDIHQFQQILWDLFRSISHGLDGTLRTIIDARGITMTQMRILVELKHRGQATVGEIGTAIGSAPGNSSAMCKTLEKKGLVSRNRSPEDERIVLITMTEQGQGLIQEVYAELTRLCDPVLAEFSAADYEQILVGITKLEEVMDRLHETLAKSQRR